MIADNNALKPLGRSIFLDRYALKDGKKKDLQSGDLVIVTVDRETGRREIGTILSFIDNDDYDVQKTNEKIKQTEKNQYVKIKINDESIITCSVKELDKPIETDPLQMIKRVAQAIGAVEKKEKRPEWEEKFRWLMEKWRFVPGGRILTGAGTDQNLTYYNCFVVPQPKDSRSGIMETLTQMTEIMSRGGGVGMNLSSLRPHYSYVRGVNGRSSGAVSWGALYSFVTGLIEQGGSRRGALMLVLNDWHPDILEFIRSKREMGRITNANISVAISDAFMEAVKQDADWGLQFPDTDYPDYNETWDGNLQNWIAAGKTVIPYRTVKAREIWTIIIESAWQSAEPGVVFIDRYNSMSNSWYYNTILCTNPCGEQGLPPWGVCNLGALNLAAFVQDTENTNCNDLQNYVLWDDLEKAVTYGVRFLDNVIDDTPYFFVENEKQQLNERRIGLGTMGLAEMLVRLKIRYGSRQAEEFLDTLYSFIAVTAYKASAALAQEKGAFPLFEADKYLQSGFMRNMPEEVRQEVEEKGIRNVTLLTQAPTGSTGTMIGTSTGIEPYYFWEWERKSRIGTYLERVDVYDEWIKKNGDNKPLPDYFVTAMDLHPQEHIRVQAAIQKWVDSSISKTSNTPNHYSIEQTKELYEMMYDLGCKGGTVYRDGCRDEQVLSTKKREQEGDQKVLAARSAADSDQRQMMKQSGEELRTRVRPTVLHGTTYRKHTPIGTAYITVNSDGLKNEEPFEVFINVAKVGSDVAADAEGLGRLISLILRMPGPLDPIKRTESIIAQLRAIGSGRQQGFGKKRVMSLPDAVAQVLEEHIGNFAEDEFPKLPDAEEEELKKQFSLSFLDKPAVDICPVCGNATFMFMEGCKKCHSCGHSEC